MEKQYDSILFDLDGTLWDATAVVRDAWNKSASQFQEVDYEVSTEDIMGVMGQLIPDIARILYPKLSDSQREILVNETIVIEQEVLNRQGAILYEGLEETLKELSRQYKLCVVSNCQSGYIESFLNAHHLEKYFTDFECPGNTGLLKGDNIKLVCERNDFKNPVYVGDTAKDAEAAQYAGVPFVFAAYGFGKVENYDYIIQDIRELKDLF